MVLSIKTLNTFNQLCKKEKTIEARVLRGYIKTLSVGMTITISHNNENNEFMINQLCYYDSFKDMVDTEVLNKIVPHVSTKDLVLQHLHNYYSESILKKNKVVAIHLTLID